MPEEPQQVTEAPVDDETSEEATTEQAPAQTPDEEFDRERALRTIRAQREEAKELKRRLKELERLVKEHEDAKLSEQERLQKRLEELTTAASDWERERADLVRERQELVTSYEVRLAASRAVTDKSGNIVRAPFIDPDDAMAHINPADIEFDEDGRPTNVEQLLTDLAKRKPYLLQHVEKPRPQGVPPTPKPADARAISEHQRAEAQQRTAMRYRLRF